MPILTRKNPADQVPGRYGRYRSKFRSILQRLYCRRVDYIFAKEIVRTPEEIESASEVRSITPDDLFVLVAFAKEHNSQDVGAVRRLQYSHKKKYGGFIAFREKKIIGYGWYATAGATHPQLDFYGIELSPAEIFTFDFYLMPAARGHNTGTEFLRQAEKILHGLGYQRAICIIEESNRRSRLVHLRAGWREIGRRHVRQVAGRILLCRKRVRLSDPDWLR